MKFKIVCSLLLASTLLFGITAKAQQEKKAADILSETEALDLFADMISRVEKYYYNDKAFNIDVIVKKIEQKVQEDKALTKHDLYGYFNEELSGKSGFYTEDQLRIMFAEFINMPSDVKIEYINDILYLKVRNLKEENLEVIEQALRKNPKKIIVDFRDNQDCEIGVMLKFANMLVDDVIILSHRYLDTKGNISFWTYKADVESTIVGNVKIAILVNNKTASTAEAVAHSLRYNKNVSYSLHQRNIQVIGQETAGKSNFVVMDRLANGDGYVLKNGEFYYNKYLTIDRIGLQPNSVVFEDNPKLDKTLIKAVQYLGVKK